MKNSVNDEIHSGIQTAFIDNNHQSNIKYRPKFLSNNYKNGQKVLSAIEEELNSCEEFIISVAFVTMSGVEPLLQTLRDFQESGKHGKILTTDYLTFSEPKALDKLAEFSNIELKMYKTEGSSEGFHTKGYIFKTREAYTIIVGSSNLTVSALTLNKEWNTRVVSTEQGEYIHDVLNEFNDLWNSPKALSYVDVKEFYKTKYELVKQQKENAAKVIPPQLDAYQLTPNDMQVNFVNNVKQLRESGEKKGLLISATGTGKTYASAFYLRDRNPRRALFIVHRETIARQAMRSYKKVFCGTKSMGLLSGTSKDFDADIIFATMNMMSKSEIQQKFKKDEFDTIIIDEVHRAGAKSYQSIMSYFEPDFWLGMTASPERTDGFDIYKLFDNNIAYEIRLQKALEEDFLCPFHYFGISDLEVDGEVFDDDTGIKNFTRLVSSERIEHILTQLSFYGYSGDRAKGLIFCSRVEEAKKLSEEFNKRNYRTEYLSGDHSSDYRDKCIERLTSDDSEDYLEYIFTVDIFNEGVDIPDVNQVVMLRPTESPIVFIQQLGRGLRKAEGKDFVVIIDFIGNYTNNFMIPIALSGDRTYNKDTIRKYVREGTKVIPGSSTVHFDEISKNRIFASIDQISTPLKMLIEKYLLLRCKLGKIPSLCDFYQFGEIDPLLFIKRVGNYHSFLLKVGKKKEPDYDVQISISESNLLDFVSLHLSNGKRPHELLLLKQLIENGESSFSTLQENIKEYGMDLDQVSFQSSINFLKGEFVNTQAEKVKYCSLGLLEEKDDKIVIGEKLMKALDNGGFKAHLIDVLELGLTRFKDIYLPQIDKNGMSLYQKYSRRDVCHLLNWEHDESSTLYGYRIKYNTCPIFVTYKKTDEVLAGSTGYLDAFVSEKQFSWMTKNKVSLTSPEAQQIINSNDTGLKMLLFVKKSDGEGSDFYYMGEVKPTDWHETTISDTKTKKALPIVNFQFEMQTPVRTDMLDYITA